MKDGPYFKQAELMLRTIPHVAAEDCFALKGGTAINLFVRDMPRLSVDIDLAYLPVDEPREMALKKNQRGAPSHCGGDQKGDSGVKDPREPGAGVGANRQAGRGARADADKDRAQ